MEILKSLLGFIVIAVCWLLLGLVSFFIEARLFGYNQLDQKAEEALICDMAMGPIMFIFVLIFCFTSAISSYFHDIIDEILRKMSNKR